MYCPYCQKQLRDDARFCSFCGKKIIRCPKCNKVLRENILICPDDGTPIDTIFDEDLQMNQAADKTGQEYKEKEDLQTTDEIYSDNQELLGQNDKLQIDNAPYKSNKNPEGQNDNIQGRRMSDESLQEPKEQNQYSRNINNKTKNRKKAVCIIFPAVLVAAAIIAGSIYYMQVKDDSQKSTAKTNSQSDSKTKSAKVTEKPKVTSVLEPTTTPEPKSQNPELEAYSALLSNGTDNGQMAVFDLNKDGIYEVALRDASVSEELPDGVGILSYSSDEGMIITPLDSIQYVGYINESAGQLMTDVIKGKTIYFFKELMSDGYFSDLESYCLPYLREMAYETTVDDIITYNELAEGMEEPNWVSITDENIQKYLSGKGKSTGTSGARPAQVEVPEDNGNQGREIGQTPTFTDAEIAYFREQLGVPDNDNITYTVGTVWLWDSVDPPQYLVDVDFEENGQFVAGAEFNVDTLEMTRGMIAYGSVN